MLIAGATFTSLTRAAWIGAAVGAVVFVVLMWRLKQRLERTGFIALAALLVLIGVTALMSAGQTGPDSNVIRRAQGTSASAQRNASSRLESWQHRGGRRVAASR